MKKTIRFGICSDVHYGTMPDELNRFQQFIDCMNHEKVDFIVSLGDFCPMNQQSDPILKLWNDFKGLKYHVLGNHDMDGNTKEEAIKYLAMPFSYYSFDYEDYHFIVTDTNSLYINEKEIDYNHGNYYSHPKHIDWFSQSQLEWLKNDLQQTEKKTILFSHQYLGDPVFGIKNATAVTKILQEAKDSQGNKKVVACINGHHHTDGVKIIGGIYYINMNSMSFFYMDSSINITRFSEAISNKYPILRESAPYKDPLFTIFKVSADSISCNECTSEFVGPSPLESGHCGHLYGHFATPKIEKKRLKL